MEECKRDSLQLFHILKAVKYYMKHFYSSNINKQRREAGNLNHKLAC